MEREIRPIRAHEVADALELVNEVFIEFVLPYYSEEGRATFAAYLAHKLEEVSQELDGGEKRMWGCFEAQTGALMGVAAVRGPAHICLFFVRKAYHRQGVGKALFRTVLEDAARYNAQAVTVNASPYAVEVYRRLGFVETDAQQDLNGIRYTPMRYALENKQACNLEATH